MSNRSKSCSVVVKVSVITEGDAKCTLQCTGLKNCQDLPKIKNQQRLSLHLKSFILSILLVVVILVGIKVVFSEVDPQMIGGMAMIGFVVSFFVQQWFNAKSFILSTQKSQARCIIKMAKPNVVFVLGAPGAGKGTQCQRIVDKYGYVHLSAGDLLRAEQQTQGSEHGQVIEHHTVNKTIVPVKITCSLLERAMKESEKIDFLIDGFPRNEDNLTGWTEAMGDKVNLKFVLNIDCEQSTCIER